MCYYLVVISMKIELIKANAQNVSVANELLTMLIKTEKSYIENIKDDFVITLNYENIYKNDDNYLYFATINGKIVGYLFGYIINDYINKSPVAKLDALYVLKEYRNMNIATKLIEDFKLWCQKNNIAYINVTVWSENIIAKKLYMKHGFVSKKEELFTGYKPKQYQKLVRDKIPKKIKLNNEEPITKVLSDLEYKLELEKKLYEEYTEVLNASGADRIEELADMLEVMISLAKLENKSLEDILKIRQEKKNKRGGFEEKIYLEKVAD